MCKRVGFLLIILLSVQVSWGYLSVAARAADPKQERGRKIAATKAELFQAAKKILVLNSYELKAFDEAAGAVSTEAVPMRINVSGCDCDMIKWQAKDKRPIINVSVDVKVDDNRIAIQAHIIGDYPKEQISEKMIEDDLFDQILRYLQ